jgi:hypothetical protein
MMNIWTRVGVAGALSLAALALTSAGAFAAQQPPVAISHFKAEGGGTQTGYDFPATEQVTISTADPSLVLPNAPTFYFLDGAAPTFNPTSANGQGTFDPAGTLEGAPATFNSALSDPGKGVYVYNVPVPAALQTGQSSPYMYVFSNYEWYANGAPANNYSMIEDLVQALPEFPLALLAPAAVLGAWYLQRRRKIAKSM